MCWAGVNQQQIFLYWNIGKTISANVRYGNKFVENFARDIKTEFPNSTGYSVRNLKYMNRFARFVDDFQIVQTLSAQLTWSHSVLKDIHKPIGVTEYKLSDFVPAEFADTL
ncbi:MAG: DUF1016 N-terminal domain-containing protein, partial [Bacteroidales bacterium]|nr:DUF1016 N-terminal domain-containing protein [Bacteroidales bacterium]